MRAVLVIALCACATGTPEVKPALTDDDKLDTMLRYKADLASCADRQHASDPHGVGKLVMRWRVLPSGETTDVTVVSEEVKNTLFAECITKVIGQLRFPATTNPGEPIIFPFKF